MVGSERKKRQEKKDNNLELLTVVHGRCLVWDSFAIERRGCSGLRLSSSEGKSRGRVQPAGAFLEEAGELN